MHWKSAARYNEYSKYGGYCNRVRAAGKEPLPFHSWKGMATNSKVLEEYTTYCGRMAEERKIPMVFHNWLAKYLQN